MSARTRHLAATQYIQRGRRIMARRRRSDRFDARLRAAAERPHGRLLWGKPHAVTPRLLTEVFGDGRALLALTPTNQRPNYYVIRVDAAWAADSDGEFRDHLDRIKDAIEEEFGGADWCANDCGDRCDGDHTDRRPWPAADFETGCSWGPIEWAEFGLAVRS